jgi:plastocyanin
MSVAWLMVAASLGLVVPAALRAQQPTRHIELILADYRFAPAQINIQAGQPVVLTLSNKDSLTPHNFTLQDAAAGLDIDANIAAGKSVVVEFTPRASGTYTFYCNKKLPLMKSHRDHGMQGTLTVTPASAD